MYYELSGAIAVDVNFSVTFEDETSPLFEVPVARSEISSPIDACNDDQRPVIHMRIPLTLVPFEVPKPGRLQIRAKYSDGSILKLGSIAIRTIPSNDFDRRVIEAAVG
jgi:hypothetical protein